jgi:hypothetical protein
LQSEEMVVLVLVRVHVIVLVLVLVLLDLPLLGCHHAYGLTDGNVLVIIV